MAKRWADKTGRDTSGGVNEWVLDQAEVGAHGARKAKHACEAKHAFTHPHVCAQEDEVGGSGSAADPSAAKKKVNISMRGAWLYVMPCFYGDRVTQEDVGNDAGAGPSTDQVVALRPGQLLRNLLLRNC